MDNWVYFRTWRYITSLTPWLSAFVGGQWVVFVSSPPMVGLWHWVAHISTYRMGWWSGRERERSLRLELWWSPTCAAVFMLKFDPTSLGCYAPSLLDMLSQAWNQYVVSSPSPWFRWRMFKEKGWDWLKNIIFNGIHPMKYRHIPINPMKSH